MKIENETLFSARLLRTIICAVYNRLKKTEGNLFGWDKHITYVKYGRERVTTVGGRGSQPGYRIWLFLPKGKCDVADLAFTIEHELLHNYGICHRKMPKVPWSINKDNFQWAVDQWGEYIYPNEPKKKTTDIREERYKRLLKREKTWATKLKRAQNALTKIKKSKRYYEKALAAKKSDANPQ